jgi:hypothetical protein
MQLSAKKMCFKNVAFSIYYLRKKQVKPLLNFDVHQVLSVMNLTIMGSAGHVTRMTASEFIKRIVRRL